MLDIVPQFLKSNIVPEWLKSDVVVESLMFQYLAKMLITWPATTIPLCREA